jgi:hypothetical protein
VFLYDQLAITSIDDQPSALPHGTTVSVRSLPSPLSLPAWKLLRPGRESRAIGQVDACIPIEPIALFWLTLATGNRYRSREFKAIPPAVPLTLPLAQKSICLRKVAVLLRSLARLIARVPGCAGFKWMTTGRFRICLSIFSDDDAIRAVKRAAFHGLYGLLN